MVMMKSFLREKMKVKRMQRKFSYCRPIIQRPVIYILEQKKKKFRKENELIQLSVICFLNLAVLQTITFSI